MSGARVRQRGSVAVVVAVVVLPRWAVSVLFSARVRRRVAACPAARCRKRLCALSSTAVGCVWLGGTSIPFDRSRLGACLFALGEISSGSVAVYAAVSLHPVARLGMLVW